MLAFGLIVAWATLVASEFDPIVSLLLIGIIYLVLRVTTKPLSRTIARLRYSIRWKFEVGIAAIAVLFLIVSLIQIGAMNFMHDGLHDIQDLMAEARGPGLAGPAMNDPALTDSRGRVIPAINNLEGTHHWRGDGMVRHRPGAPDGAGDGEDRVRGLLQTCARGKP